jgi:hypothetical protein
MFGIIEYKYNVSESQDQPSQQILSFYASSETKTFFYGFNSYIRSNNNHLKCGAVLT